ncbi:13552_t:CDS:2, partial [Dentiscutata heterogama]
NLALGLYCNSVKAVVGDLDRDDNRELSNEAEINDSNEVPLVQKLPYGISSCFCRNRIKVEKNKQRRSNIIKKIGKNYRPLNVKYYQEENGIEKSIAI